MHTYVEISALNAAYWLRVDQRVDLSAADLYVEDGVFVAGSLELHGRAAIAEFFAIRNREQVASGRRTRHLHVNLDIDVVAQDRVICRSTVAVFAGTGELPIDITGPSTIADAEDVCARGADGRWRFESRRLYPVFVGAGAAGFARSA